MPPGSRPFVLIAAVSGRALAEAARRAGYRPLVADLFRDLDTSEAAFASERVGGSLAIGFRRSALLRALERLAEGRAPIGLVYGSGFERRPSLLRELGERYGLIGNPPDVVTTMSDPAAFSALCRSAAVPHPEIRDAAAPDGNWLEKRSGGAGGAHIRQARPGRAPRRGHYLQRRVEGRPVSALFLADGRACRVLGFSEQWAAPLPGRRFRYGGAVRPAALDPRMAREMADAVARLVAASSTFVVAAPPSSNPSPRKTGGGVRGIRHDPKSPPPPLAGEGCRGGGSPAAGGLVGLNSADFLVRADGFDLLEINPRPGATLDIFSDAEPPLFELHIQACRGRLPDRVAPGEGARAAAVVYAPRPCVLPDGFPWPEWAADRQPPGAPVPPNGPLCTVRARANDAAAARHLVERRIAAMLELTGMGR